MPRLIAIDVGSHSVKLSTWRVTGREVQFENRRSERVPQSGDAPGLEARMAALDALLDEDATFSAAPSDRCVLGLPGHLATFNRLTMPFEDRAKIEQTLRFALEAEVPFDLDDMALAWRSHPNGGASDIMTAAARREDLRAWIQALASRSLDPELVCAEEELIGSVGKTAPGTDAYAVLDVGHTHSSLAVVVNGRVESCRAINVGGHAFTRAIQTALKCSWDEAEARKHGVWVAESPDDENTDPGVRVTPTANATTSGYDTLPSEARQAVDGAMGLLLAEVRSTLIRCEDDLKMDVDAVFVTGGGARIRRLWDYLAHDLGVPVKPAQAIDGSPLEPEWALTEAAYNRLQDVGHRSMDLRVDDLAFRGGTDMLRAVLTYGTTAALCFAICAVLMFGYRYRSYMVEQSEAEDRIVELVRTAIPETPDDMLVDGGMAVAFMQEMTLDATRRAELLGSGDAGVPPTIDLLSRLTEALPSADTVTIEVRSLSITPTTIEFEAQTNGYASSALVEEALQKVPDFAAATKGQETKLSNNHVKFPITIPRDGSESDAEEDG